MELRRNQMKYFSSDNMRLLSSLILSLSSKQSAMEDKLIDYWTPSTAYIKDESMVIYDDAIQICKISNADAVFDQNKWLKLSPEITELTKDDISALINLSPEEISKLSDLISTEIRLDKVFSSSDTYTRIQAAIETAKEYTNNQLGKAVKPAYKVVSSTSEVTETGYFYLISNGTNYDMYVLSADGSVVSLGTSDVDLTQFYDKNYIDNNFYTSADADGKFATITTVDGKVDKDKILTATSTTATDDELYSAKAINTELTNHTDNTDIHVTTADKTKWDKVTDKVDTTDLDSLTTEINTLKTALDKKADTDNVGDNIIVTPHTQIGPIYTIQQNELNRFEIDVAKSGYTCIGLLSLQDNHGSYTQFKGWFVENNKVVLYVFAGVTFSDYRILASLLYKKN